MEKEEIVEYLRSLSKEDLIKEWVIANTKQEDKEHFTYRSWIKYLGDMSDPTGFNWLVLSNAFRRVEKMVNNGEIESYKDIDAHLDEIRIKVEEDCRYLPDMKAYFGCRTKKDMQNYDLSKYKFKD